MASKGRALSPRVMGRPLDRTGADTRASLKAVAQRVFGSQGYYSARLGEIAEEAGITPGGVYNHFASKEELFVEVYHDAFEVMNNAADQILSEDSTLLGRINRYFEWSIATLQANPSLTIFLTAARQDIHRDAELRSLLAGETMDTFIATLVRDAVKTGEVAESKRQYLRAVLVGLFIGLSQLLAEVPVERHREYLQAASLLLANNLWKTSE